MVLVLALRKQKSAESLRFMGLVLACSFDLDAGNMLSGGVLQLGNVTALVWAWYYAAMAPLGLRLGKHSYQTCLPKPLVLL